MRIEIKPQDLKAVLPSPSKEAKQRDKELLRKNGGPERLMARAHSQLLYFIDTAVETCLQNPEIPLSAIEIISPQFLPMAYWSGYLGPHFWLKHCNLNCLNKFLQNKYSKFGDFSLRIEAAYNDGQNVFIGFLRNHDSAYMPQL